MEGDLDGDPDGIGVMGLFDGALVGAVDGDITIETSITTISCSSIYSCGSIQLFALGGLNDTFESIEILCTADSSCIGSSFTIDHADDVEIHCLESLSCSQMQVNITNSLKTSIICYKLRSF